MQRHDLLRVDLLAWQAMLAEHPGLTGVALVADWVSHDWPVIVRRLVAGDPVEGVPAALPLPPCYGKQRVGFSFPSKLGVVARSAVLLRDAARAAPAAWQPVITALIDLGEATGIEPRVFGALLWQHVTGLSYLTAHSDLDLLWAVPDATTAAALLPGLRRIDANSPFRLDGEVELPGGGGVNWRELAQAADTGCGDVLVKAMQGVTTHPVAELFTMAPAS